MNFVVANLLDYLPREIETTIGLSCNIGSPTFINISHFQIMSNLYVDYLIHHQKCDIFLVHM